MAWTSVKEPGRQGWLLWAGYFATLVVLMDRRLSVDAAPVSAVASAQGMDVYLAMLILGYPVLLAVRGCCAVGQLVLAFVGALVFGYGAVVVLLAI